MALAKVVLLRTMQNGNSNMNEKRFFADVDLPFHVWVREGPRWVLRDAADRLDRPAAPHPAATNAKGDRDGAKPRMPHA